MALQAEILLSQYFFHCNRLLEGRFHASAAMSLAVLCNLPNGLSETAAQARLPPPIDVVEQDERREAWLATLTLDKTWAVALSVPSPLVQKEENVVPSQADSPWFPSPRECSLVGLAPYLPSEMFDAVSTNSAPLCTASGRAFWDLEGVELCRGRRSASFGVFALHALGRSFLTI